MRVMNITDINSEIKMDIRLYILFHSDVYSGL